MHAVVYVFVTADIACTLMMMHAVVVSTSLMSLECPVVLYVIVVITVFLLRPPVSQGRCFSPPPKHPHTPPRCAGIYHKRG